jgi:hypothetical protein
LFFFQGSLFSSSMELGVGIKQPGGLG